MIRSKAREIIWLVAMIVCIITGILQTVKEGFSKSYMFFVFAIFAFVFYYVHHYRRTKEQHSK